MNLKENNEGLIIAGTIGNYGAGGLCDMRAVLKWDGQEYTELAISQGGGISSLAFDFEGKTYSSGLFTSNQTSPYNDFNVTTSEGLWDTIPGGFEGSGMDYYIHNDIAYICGAFRYCGGQPCALVCSFDGEQVVPLYQNLALEGNYAFSVIVYKDTLYTGANFSGGPVVPGRGGCAKVVNGQLELLAQGFTVTSVARALEILDDKLYMAGWFTPFGSNQSYSMMYYQNGQVYTLPSYPNATVHAMKYYNGGLYVAGDFTAIGSVPCKGVARYDGQEWTCLCNQTVYDHQGNVCVLPFSDLEIWNDTLYIGGRFDRIGNTPLKRIAKLDMSLSEAFPVNVTEQQRQELRLNVYPNPTKHELNITLPIGANAKDIIAIYDMHGRLIKEQLAGKYGGTTAVDVSCLSIGMYVIRYAGKDVVLNQSFLKE